MTTPSSTDACIHAPRGGAVNRPAPDMERIGAELRKKGVTLQLLWLEYKREHPDGYQ